MLNLTNKKISGIIILLILTASFSAKSQIDFLSTPLDSLVKKSKHEQKPIFLFISNNNNDSWWMEHNVLKDIAIGKLYNENFVCGIIHVNEKNKKNIEKKFSIKKYPTLIYFDTKSGAAYYASGGQNPSELMLNGKFIANEVKLLDVPNHKVNEIQASGNDLSYEINDNDGRFTLGVKGQRLMYGFPYPNSTSHFVVSANDKKASNSPRFSIGTNMYIDDYLRKKTIWQILLKPIMKKTRKHRTKIKAYKDIKYLNDTLKLHFDEINAMHSFIDYDFNGLIISQQLIPLNEHLDTCGENDNARYYQITYTLENTSNNDINAGLLVLYDMMIDDNDAAQMDVFSETEEIEKVKRSIKINRGKYAKYMKSDGIERILVYRNKRLTDGLTGDFRLLSTPDELHIGSWPTFYSTLWDVPVIKKGEKYYDSAIILKWKEKALSPGEKRQYSTVFGLYNQGILELIPAGTNFMGTDKEGKRISLPKPSLVVVPDTIYAGEKAVLKWETKNPTNADVYISERNAPQRNKGKMVIKPKKTSLYYLRMLDRSKEIANTQAKIVVLERPEKIAIDGKFTFGSLKNPITFGYPFPYSTSYFEIKADGEIYANNKTSGSNYLVARQDPNLPIEKQNELIYYGKDFEITQRIIPLDKEFNLTNSTLAKYYKVEYLIKNTGKDRTLYNFKQILDFSSFKTDSIQLQINKKTSKFYRTYSYSEIPSQIRFDDYLSNKNICIKSIISGYEKPFSISVGDWHFLKNMNDTSISTNTQFNKSPALLFNWRENIYANESAKLAFIVGIDGKKDISYTYNKSTQVDELTIKFETNKHQVSKKARKQILSFINKSNFDFVIIEGFSDNRGSLEFNHLLAKSRIEAIKNILLKSAGVPINEILDKVHGEFFSNEKSNSETDDQNERIVKIVLYKENEV